MWVKIGAKTLRGRLSEGMADASEGNDLQKWTALCGRATLRWTFQEVEVDRQRHTILIGQWVWRIERKSKWLHHHSIVL